ncbi:MAG: hypothetical protein ABJC89_19950 [Acidobacteriota bacterium]
MSTIEVSEIRRRLRGAIERARQGAEDRRARTDAASRDYEEFLVNRAVPVFHQFALALTGEGHPFKVFTPAASVRLASDRSSEEFIELTLDDTSDPPAVVGRTSRGRGRRMVSSERAIRDDAAIAELTEEDVAAFLLEEVVGLVAR